MVQYPDTTDRAAASDTCSQSFPIITPSSTSQSDFAESLGIITLSNGPEIAEVAFENKIGSLGMLAGEVFL